MVKDSILNRSEFDLRLRQFALGIRVEPCWCWREPSQVCVTGCSEEGMRCGLVPPGSGVEWLCKTFSLSAPKWSGMDARPTKTAPVPGMPDSSVRSCRFVMLTSDFGHCFYKWPGVRHRRRIFLLRICCRQLLRRLRCKKLDACRWSAMFLFRTVRNDPPSSILKVLETQGLLRQRPGGSRSTWKSRRGFWMCASARAISC